MLGDSTSNIVSQREKLINSGELESPEIDSNESGTSKVAILFIAGGIMFIIGAGFLYVKSHKDDLEQTTVRQE